MTKIEAFIKDIQDKNNSVSNLLRKAKLLASELSQADFLEWINLELEGYKNNNKNYPEYRSLSGQIKAWNPYNGWVPVIFDKSEVEKQLSTRRINQSVGEIEDLLSNKSDSYEMPYPASAANEILKGDVKTKVSMFTGRSSIIGVLEFVRNRLLDWAIELKNNGVLGEREEFTGKEKQEAQSLESKFHIANIENFNGNVGDGNNHYGGQFLSPAESFWSKAFWYIFVALIVVVAGNIASALILRVIFGV